MSFGFKQQLGRSQYLVFSGMSFVIVFIVWSILSYGRFIDPFFLPAPSTIVRTTFELFTQYHLVADIWASVYRVMVAFILSAAIAIPLGVLMSAFRPIAALSEPPIDFIRYLPVPAL